MTLEDVARLLQVDHIEVVRASETLTDFGYMEREEGHFVVVIFCRCPHPKGFFSFSVSPRLTGVNGRGYSNTEGVGGADLLTLPLTLNSNSSKLRTNGLKTINKGRGKQLTIGYLAGYYFPYQCSQAGINSQDTNARALCSNFNRWQQDEGIGPEQIKELIDIFVAEGAGWCKGKTAWKMMVARGPQLLLKLSERATQEEGEAHRYDKEYWLHGAGPRKVSESEAHRYDKEYWLTGRTSSV